MPMPVLTVASSLTEISDPEMFDRRPKNDIPCGVKLLVFISASAPRPKMSRTV